MRHQLATSLLSAVGASRVFVEDVLGDLEEIAAQRRAAAESCGALWYAGEVCRLVPYAIRDGARGSAMAAVVDVTQKAIAAWLLRGILTVVLFALLAFSLEAWTDSSFDGAFPFPPDNAPMHLQPLLLAIWMQLAIALLLVWALWYLLLGYLTVCMDTTRPLITLLTTAAFDAYLHARFFGDDPGGPVSLTVAACAWSLVMLGGVWRLLRAPQARTERRQAA
jgi:hypothetical protein